MRIFVFLAAQFWVGLAMAGTELLLVEREGCAWCARWNSEIAPIYPKTSEGRTAPLRRYDVNDPLPGDIHLERTPVLTPTFILLVDGNEKGRLEGYAGDEFFWYLLNEIMKTAGVEIEPAT